MAGIVPGAVMPLALGLWLAALQMALHAVLAALRDEPEETTTGPET